MNDNTETTDPAPKSGSCPACEIAFVCGLIAGAYVAGFGFSGWLALAIGLHVWIVVQLVLRRWPVLTSYLSWRE